MEVVHMDACTHMYAHMHACLCECMHKLTDVHAHMHMHTEFHITLHLIELYCLLLVITNSPQLYAVLALLVEFLRKFLH